MKETSTRVSQRLPAIIVAGACVVKLGAVPSVPLREYLRLVPPGVHDTEETERFIIGIPQLMGHPRFDIKGVKEFQTQFPAAHNANAFASDADNNVLVLVQLKAAAAAGCDLEVPQVESGCLSPAADQGLPHDIRPVFA